MAMAQEVAMHRKRVVAKAFVELCAGWLLQPTKNNPRRGRWFVPALHWMHCRFVVPPAVRVASPLLLLLRLTP